MEEIRPNQRALERGESKYVFKEMIQTFVKRLL